MNATLIIMGATIREFVRQPGVLILLGLSALASGGGWLWRDFNFGMDDTRFLLSLGWGIQGFVSTVFAVVAVAQTYAREFDQGTAMLFRTRAVSPFAVMVGKAGGVWVMIAGFMVISSLWLILVVVGSGGDVVAIVILAHLGSSLAKLGLVIAFTTWFASYGRSVVFVVLASGGLLILGHLHPLLLGSGAWARGLGLLLPDLHWFGGPGASEIVESSGIGVTLARKWTYAGVYGITFFWLGTLAWRRRED